MLGLTGEFAPTRTLCSFLTAFIQCLFVECKQSGDFVGKSVTTQAFSFKPIPIPPVSLVDVLVCGIQIQ